MDIREILNAIDEKDRQLWANCRTQMRKVYISAHNKIIGTADWATIDDAFLDMVDIQLAELFDRSGRITSTKPLIDHNDANKIKDDLNKRDDEIKDKLSNDIKNEVKNNLTLVSNGDNATKVPDNEWK